MSTLISAFKEIFENLTKNFILRNKTKTAYIDLSLSFKNLGFKVIIKKIGKNKYPSGNIGVY